MINHRLVGREPRKPSFFTLYKRFQSLCDNIQRCGSASPRWSSSGHDKGIHANEFAGSLDFNQHTEGELFLRALLEVQSAFIHKDKYVPCQGALNSKAANFTLALDSVLRPVETVDTQKRRLS